MKIGIMSDTHDHINNIKKAIEIFRQEGVEFVIHAGDFVNPNSVRALKGIKVIGIFGNNDGDKYRLIQAFNEIGSSIKGDFYEFKQDGIKFACYHGTEPEIKNALIECGRYDVVIYGHTHTCEKTYNGNTYVLNPGTVHGFWKRATVMVFDTETKDCEIIDIE